MKKVWYQRFDHQLAFKNFAPRSQSLFCAITFITSPFVVLIGCVLKPDIYSSFRACGFGCLRMPICKADARRCRLRQWSRSPSIMSLVTIKPLPIFSVLVLLETGNIGTTFVTPWFASLSSTLIKALYTFQEQVFLQRISNWLGRFCFGAGQVSFYADMLPYLCLHYVLFLMASWSLMLCSTRTGRP